MTYKSEEIDEDELVSACVRNARLDTPKKSNCSWKEYLSILDWYLSAYFVEVFVSEYDKFPCKDSDLFRCNCGKVFMFSNSCNYWRESTLEEWKKYGGTE